MGLALSLYRMPSEDVLQPDRIAQELIERQKVLRSIAGELVQHQNMNKLIEKVRASLQREEQKLVQLGGTLREAELRLQGPDMDHEARIAALEGAKKVNVKDIVELAAKIGSSYSAPPNWTPTEPLGNRLPPAPTEEMMRSGHLGKVRMDPPKLALAESQPASACILSQAISPFLLRKSQRRCDAALRTADSVCPLISRKPTPWRSILRTLKFCKRDFCKVLK
uniref:Mediator of RNA polymerase II transcription subunit 4 n=1 Tax=Rhodosorus marinus TaxID=101924 RepID=A0A7S2ZS88_9RHOD|mmetsp:Transcript_30845/g.118229  ORF Transcript_30845/g.118229 Transcript_30845/m.118229 type:complete len:223 (+) Transcript_30845:1771-2439(+)